MKRNIFAASIGALAATVITSSVGAVKASGRMASQIRDQYAETTVRGKKIQAYKDLDHQVVHGNLKPAELERAKELLCKLEGILWPKARTVRADHHDIDSFLNEIEKEFDLTEAPVQVPDQQEFPAAFQAAEEATN